MDENTKELLARGREHYQKQEFDKADYLLRDVALRTDGYADVFDMLGVIAHSRNDYAAAARYFERAVALNPSYTEALLNLAVTYNDLGNYEAARRVYAKVRQLGAEGSQKLDPFARGKLANMHADLGHAYSEFGLLREAIDEYVKATMLCPKFADLRTRLGNLYREVGDLGRAREQYEAARDANPNYLQARVLLGVTLLAMGDAVAARSEWQAVLKQEPGNKSAQMYLRTLDMHSSTPAPAPATTESNER
jgi:tetratricopeptide (TPR) repeat protein